ncbi:hypothetical protein B0H16DRAFT_1698718 [Mycena metata]|uniref:Uncharacterized protein n=1 Tax=Mycena metata TaxID=1033252 RepID=A0AAD7MNQ3_9AGAR|nr:hypothetical protein B0H16DRAFT_1698718 [Mycena metata]
MSGHTFFANFANRPSGIEFLRVKWSEGLLELTYSNSKHFCSVQFPSNLQDAVHEAELLPHHCICNAVTSVTLLLPTTTTLLARPFQAAFASIQALQRRTRSNRDSAANIWPFSPNRFVKRARSPSRGYLVAAPSRANLGKLEYLRVVGFTLKALGINLQEQDCERGGERREMTGRRRSRAFPSAEAGLALFLFLPRHFQIRRHGAIGATGSVFRPRARQPLRRNAATSRISQPVVATLTAPPTASSASPATTTRPPSLGAVRATGGDVVGVVLLQYGQWLLAVTLQYGQ